MNPTPPPADPTGVRPVGPGADPDDERTRREFLGHETSVRAVGGLFSLAVGMGAVAVALLLRLPGIGENPALDDDVFPIGLVAAAVSSMVLLVALGALGSGLARLRGWARWATMAATVLGLPQTLGGVASDLMGGGGGATPRLAALGLGAVALAVGVALLALLLSSRSDVVFSRSYRDVVGRTPHVASRTGLILRVVPKMAALLIVGLIAASCLVAITRPGSRAPAEPDRTRPPEPPR